MQIKKIIKIRQIILVWHLVTKPDYPPVPKFSRLTPSPFLWRGHFNCVESFEFLVSKLNFYMNSSTIFKTNIDKIRIIREFYVSFSCCNIANKDSHELEIINSLYKTLCTIWYHLYNLKNAIKTHGRMLLLAWWYYNMSMSNM